MPIGIKLGQLFVFPLPSVNEIPRCGSSANNTRWWNFTDLYWMVVIAPFYFLMRLFRASRRVCCTVFTTVSHVMSFDIRASWPSSQCNLWNVFFSRCPLTEGNCTTSSGKVLCTLSICSWCVTILWLLFFPCLPKCNQIKYYQVFLFPPREQEYFLSSRLRIGEGSSLKPVIPQHDVGFSCDERIDRQAYVWLVMMIVIILI